MPARPVAPLALMLAAWIVGCTLDTEGGAAFVASTAGSGGSVAKDASVDVSVAAGSGPDAKAPIDGSISSGGEAGFDAGSAGASGDGGAAGGGSAGATGGGAGAGGVIAMDGGAGAGGVVATGGAAGAGGVIGTGGSGPTCPTGTKGPSMVLIQRPQSIGGAFCIDSTEVTAKQYAEFLAAVGDDDPEDEAPCGWNLTYAPEAKGACDLAVHGNATAHPSWPMVCIDWCDARDYCAWAGKRLCGNMSGESVAFNDAVKSAASEWAHACTSGGKHAYPYGAALFAGKCVDDAYDGVEKNGANASPEAVGAATGCTVMDHPQLVDMSGNVWEWTDSCEGTSPPEKARCRDLGGSFWDFEPNILRCASDHSPGHVRNLINKNVGIRCCADVE